MNINGKFTTHQGITKECRSIVRGESVYLTMLSGHIRHTHSVSVPNISVLLHTHVEAVLKYFDTLWYNLVQTVSLQTPPSTQIIEPTGTFSCTVELTSKKWKLQNSKEEVKKLIQSF